MCGSVMPSDGKCGGSVIYVVDAYVAVMYMWWWFV